MNIHEHQAKELLKSFGAPVPEGYVVFTEAEARAAAEKLAGPVRVVKAQIHAGGRGKGGGVKVVKSVDDAVAAFNTMFGMQLITPQTGAEGRKVQRVYIESGADIRRELYLSVLLDRARSCFSFIVSPDGGMDIEEVAHNTPERITTVPVNPASGVSSFHGRKVAKALGLEGEAVKDCVALVQNLYRAVVETDASLLEVNPLVVTGENRLICLDAKMNFDDNGLYRQAKVAAYRDLSEEDPAEIEASKYDLSYIKLDGAIGCMVNGAGLAMATMDIVKLYGGEPANFLDVGGGATQEKVTAAFKIILSDPNVRGILVNIFGGIMRCNIIADGVVAAAREIGLKVPLVVRLEGTNVQQGKDILAASGLPIISADDLADAAQKIVEAVYGKVAAAAGGN